MNKKNGIIRFQRLYRYSKFELEYCTSILDNYKNIFLNICKNLTFLSNYLLINTNMYFNILNSIRIVNQKMLNTPEEYTFRYLKIENTNISQIMFDLNDIYESIVNLLNIISSNSFEEVLHILLTHEWIYNFDNSDANILNILIKILNPIKIWDSDYHKNEQTTCKKIDNIDLPRNSVSNSNIEEIISSKHGDITSIVIGDINLPNFLKNLHTITEKANTDNYIKNFTFNYEKVLEKFNNIDNDVIIEILKPTDNLILSKFGLLVYIKIQKRIIVICGIVTDDLFNIFSRSHIVNLKLSKVKEFLNAQLKNIPNKFKKNYIETLNIRDILVKDLDSIKNSIEKLYLEIQIVRKKNLSDTINEFLLSNKFKKYSLIKALLLHDNNMNNLAYLLYDILKYKDKKHISTEIINSLHFLHRKKLINANKNLKDEMTKFSKLSDTDISYEKKIYFMNVNEKIKSKALDKLKLLKNNFQGDSKAQNWLDGILRIPFNIYKENKLINKKNYYFDYIQNNYNIKLNSIYELDKHILGSNYTIKNEYEQYKKNKLNYLTNVEKTLNESVYGHDEAKKKILQLFGQWINGKSTGTILGLCGPPGTGKTSLAKKGISKCLIDNENISRPFHFLPVGGSTNGSTLVGHNYTYVGATWGRIVDILIDSKCMNPIIFIDELDKVSNTEHGREIISILTHLTDSTQNDSFEDKYFSGIPFDLSKALIIFSFNNLDLIDPILKDRITVIDTKPFTINDKIKIIENYILPEIFKNNGFSKDDIILENELIEYIINTYTHEAGVRKIKEKLIDIFRDINLEYIYNKVQLPFKISKDYINKLFEEKPKIRIKKIPPVPTIGLVNGLYATTSGIGGITIIQVMKYPSDKILELSITGQQGDVMKESCEYAKRIAYELLTEDQKITLEKKKFGIHIHTPDAATKKDGPSAGAAMTLAIYSLLVQKEVNNKVALTGEIDLCKNITAIGGVYAKLVGAKKSGITKALIPKENLEDLEILRKKNISPEDETFSVETIECIEEVLEKCLI